MIRPGVRRLFRLPGRETARTDRELDEELRLHLELRVEQLRGRGWGEAEAWEEARRRFGTPRTKQSRSCGAPPDVE
jgi:hypothetical protein